MGGTSSGPGHIRYISNKGRGRKGGGRVSSPAPKGAGGRRKLFEGPTNWYKVTVSVNKTFHMMQYLCFISILAALR